ncbi:anthranilate synthase component I [Caldalkalibacillus salinus]|uniref:anthranilate synthase component I n=1 Tax=Caldalkalibacillus salinus TaxID=2803787 RepID=UPI001921CE21|nr:anthranilate synthase component I [Caldalkalibacillus salinus]
MFEPSTDDVLTLSQTYNYIPIRYKVWSDNLTPIRLFQQVKSAYSFLLESVEGGEKWARYSFIGHDPYLLFTVREKQAYLQRFDDGHPQQEIKVEGDPLTILKDQLDQYHIPPDLDLPRFSGGAVGYIGYDAITLYEDIPTHRVNDLNQDQLRLMFCNEIIAFDHLKQEITFMTYLQVDPQASEKGLLDEYEQKKRHLQQRVTDLFYKMNHALEPPLHLPEKKPDADWRKVKSNVDKQTFEDAVNKVKAYIRAGDVFQTVLSQRFEVELQTDPFNIYRVLRIINPSPYLYYLDLGQGDQLIGSSPERLVQIERDRVETNPIAGTRKRGRDREQDDRLAHELLTDEKERAEHHMLLDLGRNDIGRIAEFGTVEVSKMMEIERFSHVMHIVSTVTGKKRQDFHAVDGLFSCFPAGTVTGAPKIRAMSVIAELEKEARNAYAGAIGYFSFTGHLDSCITIRTIVVSKGKAYVQAGAGVVADSVPELEWKETRNKARALLIAIQMAEDLFEHNQREVTTHA